MGLHRGPSALWPGALPLNDTGPPKTSPKKSFLIQILFNSIQILWNTYWEMVLREEHGKPFHQDTLENRYQEKNQISLLTAKNRFQSQGSPLVILKHRIYFDAYEISSTVLKSIFLPEIWIRYLSVQWKYRHGTDFGTPQLFFVFFYSIQISNFPNLRLEKEIWNFGVLTQITQYNFCTIIT